MPQVCESFVQDEAVDVALFTFTAVRLAHGNCNSQNMENCKQLYSTAGEIHIMSTKQMFLCIYFIAWIKHLLVMDE